MKKHPTTVEGKDVDEIATQVGKLRYDKLADFFICLSMEMQRQQAADRNVGKPNLADDTQGLIDNLEDACHNTNDLFDKYKKYMKDELK